MQIEIDKLLPKKTVENRWNESRDEVTANDFREKLAKAKAAYKRRAKKKAYDMESEKYHEKRRLESARIQEMETMRLRNIKAVNFENFREGTKKGPMM